MPLRQPEINAQVEAMRGFWHPTAVNITLGMRSREQVERNAQLYSQAVPEELWADLRDQGLIRAAG